jgi:hypothetical protein
MPLTRIAGTSINRAGKAILKSIQQTRAINRTVDTMATSKKTPVADRSHGGPGSSSQNATKPTAAHRSGPAPGSRPTRDAAVSLGVVANATVITPTIRLKKARANPLRLVAAEDNARGPPSVLRSSCVKRSTFLIRQCGFIAKTVPGEEQTKSLWNSVKAAGLIAALPIVSAGMAFAQSSSPPPI